MRLRIIVPLLHPRDPRAPVVSQYLSRTDLKFDLLSFRRHALQRLPDLLPPRGGAVRLARRFNALLLPKLLRETAFHIFSLLRRLGFDTCISRIRGNWA
jgi:hypothetical protein